MGYTGVVDGVYVMTRGVLSVIGGVVVRVGGVVEVRLVIGKR